MIDLRENGVAGAVITFCYTQELIETVRSSQDALNHLINTEQRFRNILEEAADEDEWKGHSKDMHMWYLEWLKKPEFNANLINVGDDMKSAAQKKRLERLSQWWMDAAEAESEENEYITFYEVEVDPSRISSLSYLYVMVIGTTSGAADDDDETLSVDRSTDDDECPPAEKKAKSDNQ